MAGADSDDNLEKESVSMAAVSSELQRIEVREQMLERLCQTDAHFKHQQRGDPELTLEEKSSIASAILEKNPVTFLSRYCKFLVGEDLEYFSPLKGNYEIDFYLTQISDRLNSTKNKLTVKNRRFQAMKSMVECGEYFSDAEMKWRDPYLYEQMIGQHLTEQERQAEIDKSDLSFSNILMKHLSQQEENQLYRNLRDMEEGQEEEEEESDSDEEDEGVEEGMRQDDCTQAENEGGDQPQISADEKRLLREEFLHIMQERFISGQDRQFDYR
ncbi:coiled-coil domain-containing protein 97-like isoform X2 [Liolophura sinensis]|uniref:coiled-coil domain-containing protein 97-like isoform X2 n=1 Tax=Liolophura sinensis TaxID=3198878 RepID=UPI0031595CAB